MKKIILVIFILLLCGCSVELGYDYYEYIDLDVQNVECILKALDDEPLKINGETNG